MTVPGPRFDHVLIDAAVTKLRADGHRLGAGRRAVLDALGAQSGPVTAEALAESIPEVHVSSVYRTLNLLEELGVVRHVHLAHGPARYELAEMAERVRHLVCETCGLDIAVPASVFDAVRDRLAEDYGFVLDGGHFALPGRCAACAASAR